jgi:uncharacterized SAM-binding protein YcdF (DUF218 family)
MENAFFILSKLVWGVLSPSNLIVWLMSLSALMLLLNRIQLAKWILIPTAILSLTLLIYPVSDAVIHPLESRFQKPETLPQTIDGIIVLGGGEELKLSLDWQTAEMGNGGDRFVAAAILAKAYPDTPVIFTGGSGLLNAPDVRINIPIARNLLSAVGIDQHRLIIESLSRNTIENFSYISPLLPQRQGRYLLVTSAFHMPRAIGVARQQGINVIAYPVDYRGNSAQFRQYDFDLFSHLQVLEPALREWIGLTVYYWTGKTSSWFPSPNSEI